MAGFGEISGEDAVDDETGGVVDDHRGLAQPQGQIESCGQGLIGRLVSANDLNERHAMRGIEEMEAAHALGMLDVCLQLRDRKSRSVAGDDR